MPYNNYLQSVLTCERCFLVPTPYRLGLTELAQQHSKAPRRSVPAIALVRWFGADYRQAVAYTLVLVGMFWNGTGAIALGIMGDVRWDWLPALLLGSLIGGYAGAHLAILKGNRWIKRAFEIVTLLVGFKLIIG